MITIYYIWTLFILMCNVVDFTIVKNDNITLSDSSSALINIISRPKTSFQVFKHELKKKKTIFYSVVIKTTLKTGYVHSSASKRSSLRRDGFPHFYVIPHPIIVCNCSARCNLFITFHLKMLRSIFAHNPYLLRAHCKHVV